LRQWRAGHPNPCRSVERGGEGGGRNKATMPSSRLHQLFWFSGLPTDSYIYIYPFFSILLCIPNPSLYIYLTPPFKCIFPIKIGSRGLRGKGRMRNDKGNDVSRMIWREKKGRVSSRSHVFMPSQKTLCKGNLMIIDPLVMNFTIWSYFVSYHYASWCDEN
jgi:hypothetical protein